jgi:hypothetical protein
VATVLHGWGYQNAQTGRAVPRILCESLPPTTVERRSSSLERHGRHEPVPGDG